MDNGKMHKLFAHSNPSLHQDCSVGAQTGLVQMQNAVCSEKSFNPSGPLSHGQLISDTSVPPPSFNVPPPPLQQHLNLLRPTPQVRSGPPMLYHDVSLRPPPPFLQHRPPPFLPLGPSTPNHPPRLESLPLKETSQKLTDEQWIHQWLQKIGKSNLLVESESTKCDKSLKLSDASVLVTEIQLHLKELEGMMNEEKTAPSVIALKAKINSKLCMLEDPTVLTCLRQEMKKRRKKRQRQREVASHRKYQFKFQQKKELMIDEWRWKNQQEYVQKKKNDEVSKSADLVLEKVRRKLTDVRHMGSLMDALIKLRNVRKQAASQTKEGVNDEGDHTFHAQIANLQITLSERENEYIQEESALEIMLKPSPDCKQQIKSEEKRVEKCLEPLFGEEPDASSPVYPYYLYYTAAERELGALVHIRRDWDFFVNDSGSSIPIGWVEPSDPWDDEFAATLETKSDEPCAEPE